MPSYPKNYPFYNWVPKPVGIIILFVFFLPILTVGGTYSVASTEMMSELGIISEHIQFANFATSIGMAAFCPFLYRLVVIRRQKMMCLAGFSLMYIFSYICAKTDSVFLLALCSIFMGFLRMVLMMVNLFTLIKYAGHIEAYDKITPGNEPTTDEGWDKLDIERSAAQPAIYLFFMVLGQLGTSLTAWLAFEYEWQYIHYFMMGLLLLCILITFITMPYHKYTTRRFPINFKQFGNASIFCITLTCITYVLTYGKVLDWYDDPTIQWATVCAIIAGGIFLYIESTQRNPYYQLDVFKLRTIRMGFLFYFLLMVLNSSAMFVNVFTGIGMKLDNFQNATLRQLVHAGLPHRRYSHHLAQRERRTLQISLCRRFPSIGAFRHVHVFRGTRCRTVRTDEVSGHHPFYRYDVPLFADSNLRHPTHALQISFFLDMYHAYRTHGIGSQHRSRTLYECTARTPTALRHPLCTECRHAAPRSVHLVYPDCTRYAISGKEQTRSNQHGCHIHQRTHPSASHPLCCKGNGRMDTLRLPDLHDICACRAVS